MVSLFKRHRNKEEIQREKWLIELDKTQGKKEEIDKELGDLNKEMVEKGSKKDHDKYFTITLKIRELEDTYSKLRSQEEDLKRRLYKKFKKT